MPEPLPQGDDQPPPPLSPGKKRVDKPTHLRRGWLYRRLLFFVYLFGCTIRDGRTGEVLGKAIIVPWGGRLMIIGYTGTKYFYPVFKLQKRATYWRQEVEFRTHPDPDEPSCPRKPEAPSRDGNA